MQTSLTLAQIAAIFGVMIVGAAVPSVSVLAVSARSAASGFMHGVFTTIGIMVGDILFIVLAIFGLAILAETMGHWFVLVKYLGGAYLIWLGIALWRSKSKAENVQGKTESSLLSSFLTGLFITLGDQKAILFYFGFFPAFLDLTKITFIDTGLIIAMAIIAIAVAKLTYAYLAVKARLLINSNTHQKINITVGSILIAVGVFVMAKDHLEF
ncbi:MAG TPA: LysE family translocator [Acidiferrobacteraceae bacterium]|nr:LysE family translocator [Acidiferrobacteraceae bacterium]HEX20645.1 LysE family translocator [Acidiferrobacteraceae bacterium]